MKILGVVAHRAAVLVGPAGGSICLEEKLNSDSDKVDTAEGL